MIQPISTETRVKNSMAMAGLYAVIGAGAELLTVRPENRKYAIAAIKNSFLSEDEYVKKTVDCAKKSVENLAKVSAKKAKTAPFVNNLKKYNIDFDQVVHNAKELYPDMKQTGSVLLKRMAKSAATLAALSITIDIVAGAINKAVVKSVEKKYAEKI